MNDYELNLIQQNIFGINCLSDQVSTMLQAMEKLKTFVGQINKDLGRIDDRLFALESHTKNVTEKEHQMWPDEHKPWPVVPKPWPKIGDTVYLAYGDGTVQELVISDGLKLGIAKNYQKYGCLFPSFGAALKAQEWRKKDNELV
ncbi:MAG: hypothetical protein ACYDHF_08050 [Candidatus Cryosericum sp.]